MVMTKDSVMSNEDNNFVDEDGNCGDGGGGGGCDGGGDDNDDDDDDDDDNESDDGGGDDECAPITPPAAQWTPRKLQARTKA
jgi:hypothetical protein